MQTAVARCFAIGFLASLPLTIVCLPKPHMKSPKNPRKLSDFTRSLLLHPSHLVRRALTARCIFLELGAFFETLNLVF